MVYLKPQRKDSIYQYQFVVDETKNNHKKKKKIIKKSKIKSLWIYRFAHAEEE